MAALETTDLTKLWHFDRPHLASALVDRVMRQERVALFGPRQTGKTSLLRQEVMPLATSQGALAIYIECWADKADPLGSINYGLQKALTDLTVPTSSAGKFLKTPVKKVGFASASLEMGEVATREIPQSKFLQVDALLSRLLDETNKPILLVFDEFQETARAADADAAMAALRSALTQASHRVGVVFSGSSQALLLQAFSRTKAPLYGFAQTEAYPLLKEDFVVHVASKFWAATTRELPLDAGMRVLEKVGFQPGPFLSAVSHALANPQSSVEQGLQAMLSPTAQTPWSVAWSTLTPLQRASLLLVADQVQPTAAASLERVAQQVGQEQVQASSITRALESLEKQGLIERDWGGASRLYAVCDPLMQAWLTLNDSFCRDAVLSFS